MVYYHAEKNFGNPEKNWIMIFFLGCFRGFGGLQDGLL